MRILVVAEHYPWPAVDGIRQRLHHVISGLATAGEVELIAVDRRTAQEQALTAPGIPGLVDVVAVPLRPDMTVRDWLPDWVRGGPPRRLLVADWAGMVDAFTARMERAAAGSDPPVDLIWFSHVDSWWPLHTLAPGVPSIVDYYDLVNLALRLRRATPPRFTPGSGVLDKVRTTGRWGISRGFDLVDERRWGRFQRDCAAQVDQIVVCSELDLRRSGLPNVTVIGNGSEAPEVVPTDRLELRSEHPTVLFVGSLDYEPNGEGMEWFLREVWPTVRAARPDAVVRIVGRGGAVLGDAAAGPGVELLGQVPDLGPELSGADVSIVPIRVGAGTRLKVVEALANRLPLVTTTVGCEGIDVVDGRTALVADDAAGFAAAVLRLLDDGALRQRLADAGGELFERSYTWDGIRAQVADLATRIGG